MILIKSIEIVEVEEDRINICITPALKELEELLHEKFSDKKQNLDLINDLLCDLNFKNLIRNEYKWTH